MTPYELYMAKTAGRLDAALRARQLGPESMTRLTSGARYVYRQHSDIAGLSMPARPARFESARQDLQEKLRTERDESYYDDWLLSNKYRSERDRIQAGRDIGPREIESALPGLERSYKQAGLESFGSFDGGVLSGLEGATSFASKALDRLGVNEASTNYHQAGIEWHQREGRKAIGSMDLDAMAKHQYALHAHDKQLRCNITDCPSEVLAPKRAGLFGNDEKVDPAMLADVLRARHAYNRAKLRHQATFQKMAPKAQKEVLTAYDHYHQTKEQAILSGHLGAGSI